eukprot:scaffold106522_cov41-Prasinocladus_malaysianus.AAC.1
MATANSSRVLECFYQRERTKISKCFNKRPRWRTVMAILTALGTMNFRGMEPRPAISALTVAISPVKAAITP